MKRKLIMLSAALMLALGLSSAAIAQCPPEYTIEPGNSACIHVCAGEIVNVNLQGRTFWAIELFSVCNGCVCITYVGQDQSPEGIPTLIWNAGCQTAPYCSETCNPVIPPPLVLGGDPFYPNDYYGENNCLFVYLRFVHYLAVNLTSFTALPGNGQVALNWATASESNSDHFELQRDHVAIAEIAALNQPTGSNYSWVDHSVVNGQTYSYTLVAVDVNGNREEKMTIENVRPGVSENVVTSYALYQNYPNPFNPETSIAFDVMEDGFVSLAIYNVLGEQVSTLVNGHVSSGRHTVVFNGSSLASGVYLYKLNVNGFTDAKKLVLLK